MSRIIWTVASWLRRFMSTGAMSCRSRIPCPVCVVVSLPSEPFYVDWCRRCGSDIYNLPTTSAWYNRDGKYACASNGLRAHLPLMDRSEIDLDAWRRARHAR